MVATRISLIWSLLAAWCALFAAVEVDATLQNPVMWILVHHSLKQARIDPIVSPGRASSHTHSFVGANGVSMDTTTADALAKATTCNTAGISADDSAYWAPSLYSYDNSSDTFTPKRLDYVNTYYLMRGNVPITAFPRGMQLLGGNAMRKGPGPTKQADNTVSFVCLNYKDGSSQTPTLPNRPCPQGLRTQVLFPSCWNGKDLTSSDQSHVVYPLGDNADNGDCPSSHNVRLPTLFYEFVWSVDNQNNANNSQWVFANGDSMGYSFHADFIAAWNTTVLQNAIDQCGGNLFNNLESCPPLNAVLARDASRTCTSTNSEAVYPQAISSLPGCNVVWNGPNAGQGLTPGCDPSKVMLKPDNWPAAASSTAISSTSAAPTSVSTATTSTSPAPSSKASALSSSSTPAQPAATCVCPSTGSTSTQTQASTSQTKKTTTQKKKNIKQPSHQKQKKSQQPRSLHRENDPVRRDARIVLQSIVGRFETALRGTGSPTERLDNVQEHLTILEAALADYGIVVPTDL